MNQKIINSLQTFFPDLNEDAVNKIISLGEFIELKKGATLFEIGKKTSYIYFLLTGSAKSYYFNDGNKVCLWFAFENEIIGNFRTHRGQSSSETVELLEASQLLRIKSKELKDLAKKDLFFSQLVSFIVEDYAIYLEKRLFDIQLRSGKERYQILLDEDPQIFQRVSLTDIASYLGMSRETLSRIRAEKS